VDAEAILKVAITHSNSHYAKDNKRKTRDSIKKSPGC